MNMPFAPPINSFNQYLLKNNQQFDVIREDVQNENQVSSFDHSHSHGFDLSTPAIPGFQGAGSMSAMSNITGMQGNINNVSGKISNNTSISNVNLHISANQMFKDQTQEQEEYNGTFLNTPQKETLNVEP